MSIADQTDLAVTAELLKAGLLPADDVPTYDENLLKEAIRAVAERLHYDAYRRDR